MIRHCAFEDLAKAVPNAVAIDRPLPGGSVLAKLRMDHLVVYDDLTLSDQAPLGWSPIPLERAKANGTLADWMGLPWGSPELMVLPGYHTLAENPKRGVHGVPGHELFLSVCGMLATGSRTILLSRWRSGGQSSYDLVREFLQELPHTAPADAWQRAVLLIQESRLSPGAEPRIKFSINPEELKGDHPFLWAGYLLVDCGDPVERADAEAAERTAVTDGKAGKAAAKKPPAPDSKQEPKPKSPKPKAAGETLDGEKPEAAEPKAATAPAPPKPQPPEPPADSEPPAAAKNPPAAQPPNDAPAAPEPKDSTASEPGKGKPE